MTDGTSVAFIMDYSPPLPRQMVVLLAGLALAVPAAAQQDRGGEFADLSIEELANIQVTSVSKRPERLQDAPASVFVITADDIRRAGAATLPEALRLAPNLHVAQVSNTGYSISARGLNGSSNSAPNKLLVLIDGRSVYTPLFSGVFWDAQDVLIEDIERIEVISGPGGTLWGVNAFNGVINVTTRPARATAGTLGVARLSNRGGDLAFRSGQRSAGVDYRVYGKVFTRTHNELSLGGRANDDWRQGQFGLRADWERGADRFSVNGNLYRGRQEQPEPGLINITGSNQRLGIIRTEGINVTGRWERRLERGGMLSLQAYIDHTRREVPPSFTESLDIADLQFQHNLPALGRHNLVWGANYRHSWDRVTNSAIVAFLPASDRQSWTSMFARDEIALRDNLQLTLGVRVERSPYTKAELLPNARLAWKPAGNHLFWARTSRAIRAPSRLDVDAFIPGSPPYVLAGGPAVRSEVGKVFELGYRGQPAASLSYSVAVFHNHYDHLRTQELLPSGRAVAFANLMEGQATGIEAWGNWQASARWRLSAGMTALKERFRLKPGSNDVASLRTVGRDPAHTAQLRSTWVIDDARDVELALRRVGPLGNPQVPGYTAVDARFGWRLRPGLDLSVSGQNLNGSHPEFGAGATRIEIPRTVAVKLVWQN